MRTTFLSLLILGSAALFNADSHATEAPVATHQPTEVPSNTLRSIKKDIRNWKIKQAQQTLQQALTDYPHSAKLALLEGKIHYLDTPRQFDLAIDALNRAEQLGSKDPELYFYRAAAKSQPTESYLDRKSPDYMGAVADYRKAQLLKSERDLRLEITRSLFDAGEYKQALAAADDYLAHKPQISLIPDMRLLRGKILAELGRHEDALTSYQKAAKRYRYLDKLYYYQAVSLRALGKLTDAQAAIQKGLSKKGRNQRQLLYVRATIYSDLQQHKAAYQDFALLWRHFQGWALPILGCYNNLMKTELAPQAGQYLDMAIELDPQVVLHFYQQDLLKL